ncbi:Cytochrome P450 [Mycena kentingensis (nom. inval.)]|nr:Cytochrome P450 [Mycena kentingensis (nom. inval.)]
MANLTLILLYTGAVTILSYLKGIWSTVIPAHGGADWPFAYYFVALRVILRPQHFFASIYASTADAVVRIPAPGAWDNVLSFNSAVDQMFQSRWTLHGSRSVFEHPIHLAAMSKALGRNLDRCMPDLYDEVVHACEEAFSAMGEDKWRSVDATTLSHFLVARTNNRVFVGLPFCRDPQYTAHTIGLPSRLFVRGSLVRMIPEFLRPYLARFVSGQQRELGAAIAFLRPILEQHAEQHRQSQESGNPTVDRDLITSLLDALPADERTVEELAVRIMLTNTLPATFNTNNALTALLYDLADYPEYIPAIRAEAHRLLRTRAGAAVSAPTKAELDSMPHLERFIRESQRLNGTSAGALFRRVVAPNGFVFSDGVHIPHGAVICVPGMASVTDNANYADASTFNPYRSTAGARAASTSLTHLTFGHGRQACPGRFFTVVQLKLLLAYIVLHFDIRPGWGDGDEDGKRPKDVFLRFLRFPSMAGKCWCGGGRSGLPRRIVLV